MRQFLRALLAARRPACFASIGSPVASILKTARSSPCGRTRRLHLARAMANTDKFYKPYFLECCKKTCPPLPKKCLEPTCGVEKELCCRCPKRRQCCVKIRTTRRYAKTADADVPNVNNVNYPEW